MTLCPQWLSLELVQLLIILSKWLLLSWLLHKQRREFSDTNFEIGKALQGFPISKLVLENSLFRLHCLAQQWLHFHFAGLPTFLQNSTYQTHSFYCSTHRHFVLYFVYLSLVIHSCTCIHLSGSVTSVDCCNIGSEGLDSVGQLATSAVLIATGHYIATGSAVPLWSIVCGKRGKCQLVILWPVVTFIFVDLLPSVQPCTSTCTPLLSWHRAPLCWEDHVWHWSCTHSNNRLCSPSPTILHALTLLTLATASALTQLFCVARGSLLTNWENGWKRGYRLLGSTQLSHHHVLGAKKAETHSQRHGLGPNGLCRPAHMHVPAPKEKSGAHRPLCKDTPIASWLCT